MNTLFIVWWCEQKALGFCFNNFKNNVVNIKLFISYFCHLEGSLPDLSYMAFEDNLTITLFSQSQCRH